MKRIAFPGCWYADALPSGEFAVLMPGSHLITHDANIKLPPGDEPLYHRITNVGGFQIAGQGHYQNVTWWWTADHGWVRKPVAIGVSPVIFDHLGELHLSDGSIGSQGWRFVDAHGHMFTGDETYYSASLRLNEWTDLSENFTLVIGQSHDDNQDNAWVWDGTHHRQLGYYDKDGKFAPEPGPCRFIRAARSGDQVAVAIWKPNFGAVLYWLTVAELRALPIVQAVPPMLPPKPIPEPAPTPEPKPVSIPNQLPTVQQVRGNYPTPLGAAHASFLIEVAKVTGAKLLRKDSGTRIAMTATIGVSQDILMFGNQGVDILSDGEGAATPTWNEKGVINGEYIDVTNLGTTIPAPGTPDPIPAQPSPDETAVALASIMLGLGDLRAQLERIETQLGIVVPTVVEHAARPITITFPKYKGSNRFLGTISMDPQA